MAMTEICQKECYRAEDHERQLFVERRLTSLEAKLDSVNEKLDSAILCQLKDHGKRIAALEKARAYSTGWIVGVAAATGAVCSLVAKLI